VTVVSVRGDAACLPFPAGSVDLIVTSPPYFALRDYRDGDASLRRQVGAEPTPAEYLEALWACTAEWVRVLKPGGSIFVNLGDKYSGAQAQSFAGASRTDAAKVWQQTNPRRTGIPDKSLMLLPERYRIGCVDRLGLIARAVVVWDKPNGLPESVTDRVRRSHEDWVHLTKSGRYFSAVDEIREGYSPNKPWGAAQTAPSKPALATAAIRGTDPGQEQAGLSQNKERVENPLGKLPGSVWTVATEPLTVPGWRVVVGGRTVRWFDSWEQAATWCRLGGAGGGRPSIRPEGDHFAAFPSEWPRRLVLGWSPAGVCTACGEGRRPVMQAGISRPAGHGQRDETAKRRRMPGEGRDPLSRHGEMASSLRTVADRAITGYVCACTPYTDHPGTGGSNRRGDNPYGRPGREQGVYSNQAGEYERVGPRRDYHFDEWTPAPTRPAVVLDPFGGTGTTAHVASALGRVGVTVDLSHSSTRMSRIPQLQQRRRNKVLGLESAPKAAPLRVQREQEALW
jgi:DNA modification methylase